MAKTNDLNDFTLIIFYIYFIIFIICMFKWKFSWRFKIHGVFRELKIKYAEQETKIFVTVLATRIVTINLPLFYRGQSLFLPWVLLEYPLNAMAASIQNPTINSISNQVNSMIRKEQKKSMGCALDFLIRYAETVEEFLYHTVNGGETWVYPITRI